jgi:hypothetical protein
MIRSILITLMVILLTFLPFLNDLYLRFIPSIIYYIVYIICLGFIFQYDNLVPNTWKLFIFFLPSSIVSIYWILCLLGYIPILTLM